MSVLVQFRCNTINFLDDSVFDKEEFLNVLGKSSSREELMELVEQLKRSCAALKTEKISFISDKYPEVVDAIQILTEVLCFSRVLNYFCLHILG